MVAFAGCASDTVPAPASGIVSSNASGTIKIFKGGAINYKNAEVALTAEPGGKTDDANARPPMPDYTITYVAQIPPITVGAQIVQSNNMLIKGNKAFVVYNTQGDPYVGAVQVIDLNNKQKPVVETEIQLQNMDINCVWWDQANELIFGGAVNPDAFVGVASPAFVARVDLKALDATAIEKSITPLHSWAATAILKHDKTYYVGVGAKDGGIEVLDKDFQKSAFVPYPDIRDLQLSPDNDKIIAIAGNTDAPASTPGVLVMTPPLSGTPAPAVTTAALDAYSKASMETSGVPGNGKSRLAFLALSNLGLKILDLKTNTIVFEQPNPSAPLSTCNDVSYDKPGNSIKDDGLFVTANGEYGYRIYRLMPDPTAGPYAQLMGFHTMEGTLYGGIKHSANMMEYKANAMMVATGAGGVHIYELKAK